MLFNPFFHLRVQGPECQTEIRVDLGYQFYHMSVIMKPCAVKCKTQSCNISQKIKDQATKATVMPCLPVNCFTTGFKGSNHR